MQATSTRYHESTGSVLVAAGVGLGSAAIVKTVQHVAQHNRIPDFTKRGLLIGTLGAGAVGGVVSIEAQKALVATGLQPTAARYVGSVGAAAVLGGAALLLRHHVGSPKLDEILGLAAAASATGAIGDGLFFPARAEPVATKPQYSPGSDVHMYVDEPNAFPVIENAIRGARSVVDVQMFSLLPNGSGLQLGKLLEQKARQGVEVNLEVDDVGSEQIPDTAQYRFINELKAAGVHVLRNEHGDPFDTSHVDHRKLYVIDGKTAFTGGMNVGARYDPWHDVMVQLSGPVVHQAQQLFTNHWKADGGQLSAAQQAELASTPAPAGSANVAVVENQPGTDLANTQLYLDLINSAKQRLWISTPYFGDTQLVDAAAAAAKRGVDVRIVTTSPGAPSLIPGMTDLSRSYYQELVDAGVKIYEEPRMNHAKVLLSDDHVSVGSMNMTHASAIHDYELNVETTEPALRAQVEGFFQQDFGSTHQVTRQDADKNHTNTWLARLQHIFGIQH
jgi:cardiolipin synthase